MTPESLARYFDATNLRLDATVSDIRQLCADATAVKAYSVMLYPTSVKLASDVLAGTGVKVGTVAGFPSGRFSTAAKAAEIREAAKNGADEVDVVANYAELIAGNSIFVESELKQLSQTAHDMGVLLKVIVETCYLSESLQLDALRICEAAEVDFIKTSTGFGSAGATVETIALWKANRRENIQLKAAGGIRNLTDALALIDAGADRLGLSAAIAIIEEFKTGKQGQGSGAY
ncbi:MAG: deoxyribose-phosphate aldolase [Puniceicoccaceae bacterium]